MTRCRRCNAEIFLARHLRTGTTAALDIEPVPNGPIIVLSDGRYYFLSRGDPKVAADVARYTAHVETCGARDQQARKAS